MRRTRNTQHARYDTGHTHNTPDSESLSKSHKMTRIDVALQQHIPRDNPTHDKNTDTTQIPQISKCKAVHVSLPPSNKKNSNAVLYIKRMIIVTLVILVAYFVIELITKKWALNHLQQVFVEIPSIDRL